MTSSRWLVDLFSITNRIHNLRPSTNVTEQWPFLDLCHDLVHLQQRLQDSRAPWTKRARNGQPTHFGTIFAWGATRHNSPFGKFVTLPIQRFLGNCKSWHRQNRLWSTGWIVLRQVQMHILENFVGFSFLTVSLLQMMHERSSSNENFLALNGSRYH